MTEHQDQQQPGSPARRRVPPVARERAAVTRPTSLLPRPKGLPPLRATDSRRPPRLPSPEELGTMLAVGGQPGEDERLDRGLVRAAMDPTYRVKVHLRVQDLRTRPYHPAADPFLVVGWALVLLWVLRIFGVL